MGYTDYAWVHFLTNRIGGLTMRAVGIVAEYNPFHNGHRYQIQRAKELAQADCCIVAMSGNFVQRGAPAVLDKFSRASAALANGADFVFEIPLIFAVSSAEYFATAGIALFQALGCVDAVSFGCETADETLLLDAAGVLEEEPEEMRHILSNYAKQGLPFPAARQQAALDYLTEYKGADAEWRDRLSMALRAPNNILALEYLKALRRLSSPILPIPIQREGNGYHDLGLSGAFCSATAIRHFLKKGEWEPDFRKELGRKLSSYVPPETASLLLGQEGHFLDENDFSQMLYYKLLMERGQGFSEYADGSRQLSSRICRKLPEFSDFKGFCMALKSKDMTYARISRLLWHILLNIRQEDVRASKGCGFVPYLRLLGFRKDASGAFREIKEKSAVPIVSKPSRALRQLSGTGLAMLQQDVLASDLYYGVWALKQKKKSACELQKEIVIV